MNSTGIINASVRGLGVKGWYLNKTISGRMLVKHALESKYGKQEAVLDGGIRKFVKKKDNNVETRYLNKYCKPFQTTLKSYDKDGSRHNLTSYWENPKDYHYRTSLQINNYKKLGKRESVFKRLSYSPDNGLWKVEFLEKTVINKTDDGLTITKFIKDCIKQTTETFSQTIPKEKLDQICKLFNISK